MTRGYKREPTIPALSQSTVQHQRVNISAQEYLREERSQPGWSIANSKWSLRIFSPNSLAVQFNIFIQDILYVATTWEKTKETISTNMSTSNIICCYIFYYQSGYPNKFFGLDAMNNPRKSISGVRLTKSSLFTFQDLTMFSTINCVIKGNKGSSTLCSLYLTLAPGVVVTVCEELCTITWGHSLC